MVLFQKSFIYLFCLELAGQGMVAKSYIEHSSQDNFAPNLYVQQSFLCMVLIYTNSSDVDIAAIHEILDTQPEEYSEGEFINVNNESGCNDKNKNVLRE